MHLELTDRGRLSPLYLHTTCQVLFGPLNPGNMAVVLSLFYVLWLRKVKQRKISRRPPVSRSRI